MKKTLGIIKFEEKHINLDGITFYRPLPSVAFCGRYRLMDFVISNMTNSYIRNIQIYVSRKPRSVFSHVGTGRHYNINSKGERLSVMHGENDFRSSAYNTDINAFMDNMDHIKDSPGEYVLIAASHFVYIQNYQDVINHHIESGADITMIYKSTDEAKEKFIDCNTLVLDSEKRVTKIERNRGRFKNRNVSVDCYVMKKSLFMDLVNRAYKISPLYWFIDILQDELDDLVVEGYPLRREVMAIDTFQQYYYAHMDMIRYDYAKNFFTKDWPILTRTSDSSPAFYGEKAKVVNSSISNGSKIYGTVENCFIGRNVVVEEGAELRNCVVLADVHIESGAFLNYVVVDKRAHIKVVKEIVGNPDEILYIDRGMVV